MDVEMCWVPVCIGEHDVFIDPVLYFFFFFFRFR